MNLANVDLDDAKLSRFTPTAKQKLLDHVGDFGNDLIKKSIQFTNDSETRTAEVTPSRVDDAKSICRKYARNERGPTFYFKFILNIIVALVAGGMIGELISKLGANEKIDTVYIIFTSVFILINVYLSLEILRES